MQTVIKNKTMKEYTIILAVWSFPPDLVCCIISWGDSARKQCLRCLTQYHCHVL